MAWKSGFPRPRAVRLSDALTATGTTHGIPTLQYGHLGHNINRSGSIHKPITRNPSPESDCLQDPDGNRHHHHNIQDGLDAASHRDEVVDEPQRDADNNERDDDVY